MRPLPTGAGAAADEPDALYFCVGDREAGKYCYAWRLGRSGTSFYIKPRLTVFAGFKISLHGPDARPGLLPGFKVELDQSAEPAVERAGGVLLAPSEDWPRKGWFPGRPVRAGVTHVMRLRYTWTLFGSAVPSAPVPGNIKRHSFGGLVPPPRQLRLVDVDLFVCNRRPYWPHERQARLDNACIGPLRNDAGEYLTAVAFHRSAVQGELDLKAPGPGPGTSEDGVRGFGAVQDPAGFLLVREQWLSRSWMEDRASRSPTDRPARGD